MSASFRAVSRARSVAEVSMPSEWSRTRLGPTPGERTAPGAKDEMRGPGPRARRLRKKRWRGSNSGKDRRLHSPAARTSPVGAGRDICGAAFNFVIRASVTINRRAADSAGLSARAMLL